MGNVNILQNHFWKDCPVYKGFSKEIEKMEQKQQLLNSILLGESQTTLIFKGDRDHTLQQ
jgi:hypothetical protein